MENRQYEQLRQLIESNARSIEAQGNTTETLLQTVLALSRARGRLDQKMLELDTDIRSLLREILQEVRQHGNDN